MPDEKQPDLKASLSDAWEALSDLEETINDLVLQQSATLAALAKTLPSFALEYDQAYSAVVSEQEKHESEAAPNVREELRRLRKDRT